MSTAGGTAATGAGGSFDVLRSLELTVTRRLDGLLHGDHRGLVPGHGTEPGETRIYQPGDDVRRIDWNVTARMQAPHVRETIADRELETWLLVDLSASLEFGTADRTKRAQALAAAAAVGFLTARGGNRIGALLVTGAAPPVVIPARGGLDHLRSILHRINAAEVADGTGATDLGEALHRLSRTSRRRGLAVVVSDWLDGDPSASRPAWELGLRRVAVRHETLCVEVLDRRELELPDVGVVELVDPETGRRREVQTGDARLRARYAAAAAERRARLAATFRAVGADHLTLRTDRDWVADLLAFVVTRRERAAALARSV
jgi:uncharacterized protein (DUF58 family)